MLDREDDDLPEAQYEGEWYRWSCAVCGSVFEQEGEDVRGQVVTCVDCDTEQRVQS